MYSRIPSIPSAHSVLQVICGGMLHTPWDGLSAVVDDRFLVLALATLGIIMSVRGAGAMRRTMLQSGTCSEEQLPVEEVPITPRCAQP
jgi:hypothetical protein